MAGIPNLGNTCYISTCLQCLRHCVPFMMYIRGIRSMPCSLLNMLQEFYTVLDMAPEDTKIMTLTQELYHGLAGGNFDEQRDVHEFFLGILEQLGKECPKVTPDKHQWFNIHNIKDPQSRAICAFMETKWEESNTETSRLERIFQGQLSNVTVCSNCEHVRLSSDIFTCLHVYFDPKSHSSLKDSIFAYMNIEQLEGVECEHCKGHHNARKVCRVFKYPQVLLVLVHKPRNRSIDVCLDLDLRGVSMGIAQHENAMYRLTSAACHFGSLRHGGHYIAVCKNEKDRWYSYNDTRACEVTDEKTLGDLLHRGYLFVYEKC